MEKNRIFRSLPVLALLMLCLLLTGCGRSGSAAGAPAGADPAAASAAPEAVHFAAGDVSMATINTKLNWLIGILSSIGLAVLTAVMKIVMG